MRKNYSKIMYGIAIILLMLLAGISKAAATNSMSDKMRESRIKPGIYIFVSFSMSDKSLRNYFQEAQGFGAKLIMNGLAGDKNGRNRFAETKRKMEKAKINVDINPNLFEQLSVKQVPVIAVVSADQTIKKLSGHITLAKALEIMEVSK